MSALISGTRWYRLIWFRWHSLLLEEKAKSCAGVTGCAVSPSSFPFLCSIIGKYKCLEGSPHLCPLVLGVRRSLCCSQPLRLIYAIPSSIQVTFLGGRTSVITVFSHSLKLVLAVARQRRGLVIWRPLAVCWCCLAGFLQCPEWSFGLSGLFVGYGLSWRVWCLWLDMSLQYWKGSYWNQ